MRQGRNRMSVDVTVDIMGAALEDLLRHEAKTGFKGSLCVGIKNIFTFAVSPYPASHRAADVHGRQHVRSCRLELVIHHHGHGCTDKSAASPPGIPIVRIPLAAA